MSRPTPAPWHTDGVVVWASDNDGQSFDVPVCVMTSRSDNGLATPAENAPTCGLANADLIASAPELLAALRGLLPDGWDDGTMDHMPGVLAARQAIAKATS